MITKVVITKKALRELSAIPHFINDKFEVWIRTVEEIGIEETRKISGFHDEPLKGKRKGQRSIRLCLFY